MATTVAGQNSIEHEIETVLAAALPNVDLREVQVVGEGDHGVVRIVIDHPDGVDHELCAATTHALDRAGFRDRFGIEVSSPGPEPPLRTPDHYRAALGRRVTIRVAEEAGRRARTITGTLIDVRPDDVVLETSEGEKSIATGTIRRGRIVERSEA